MPAATPKSGTAATPNLFAGNDRVGIRFFAKLMEPKPVPLFAGPLTWSSAIGLFMLNFGTLEMFVFSYLDKCLPEEFGKWRDRHFKERVERVGEHWAKTPEQQETYAAFLQQLTPVRELRNHIAHGYFQMTVRPPENNLVIGIVQAKEMGSTFSPETRHLTFTDLCAALSTLDAVTKEFQRLTDQQAGWSIVEHGTLGSG